MRWLCRQTTLADDPLLGHSRLLRAVALPLVRLPATLFRSFGGFDGYSISEWQAFWDDTPEQVVCLADRTDSEGPDLHVELSRDLLPLVSVKSLPSADPKDDADWATLREGIASVPSTGAFLLASVDFTSLCRCIATMQAPELAGLYQQESRRRSGSASVVG